MPAGAACLVLALLPGCAGAPERQARAEMERVEAEMLVSYAPGDALPSHGSAPGSPGILPGKSADSAPSLPEKPELADYLRYAALHNPGLRAAFHRWKAALEKVPQARSLPDPKFSYAYFIEEIETRVGPQQQRFSFMQMIPGFGKLRQQGNVALGLALARKHRYDATKLRLFYRVKKSYYEYYYLARAIRIVADNIKLLANIEAAIRTRYKAGAASSPALIQTQVELGKLEDRLKSLEALRTALTARLNAALGRDSGVSVPWPEKAPRETAALAAEELLQALMNDNPELHAARATIAAAAAKRKLAKTLYFPDFSLGVSLMETGKREDGMQPRDNGNDPLALMFEMTIPLWRGKYDAAVREAEARVQAAEAKLGNMVNELSADLRVALYHYDDARRKLNLFRDTLIPKGEQALSAALTAFPAGKATFLEMINAERTLLEFRLLAERALVNQAIRLAELEVLAGVNLRKTDQ